MKTYEKVTSLTPDQLHATFLGLHLRLKAAANDIIVTATPAAYVAAILAGEEWVSAWEQLARRYAADTEAAIAAHVSAQYEASIKLAGLVLAKQK